MSGGKSSSSASTSSTTNNDNRVVGGPGGPTLGAGAFMVSETDNSISVTDARQTTDARTTNTNITTYGADAPQIIALTAELQSALAEGQSDAVKFMSQAGLETIRSIGGSVTDLYETAGQNSTRTTEQLLQLSGNVIDRLIDGASKNSDAASVLAQSAISAYTPPESKAADTWRYAALAAAGVAALYLMRKA